MKNKISKNIINILNSLESTKNSRKSTKNSRKSIESLLNSVESQLNTGRSKKTRRVSRKKKYKRFSAILKKMSCSTLELELQTPDTFLKLLGEGHFGIVFKGCINKNCRINGIGIKFLTKKSKYLDDDTHPSNIDAEMGLLLSDLYLQNITPHVNLVYTHQDCDLKTLKTFNTPELNKWLSNKINNKSNNEKLHEQIKIIYNELADTDLKKIMLKNTDLGYDDHLILLFSFCYSLTCFQYHIKGFRHNDIKPNNFLIKINNKFKQDSYDKYTIFGKEFYVPCTRYTLKFHDFDYSYSNSLKNAKVTSYKTNALRTFGVSDIYNPVFDLHLYANFSLKDYDSVLEGDKKILDLYSSLIPSNTIGKSNTYVFNYKLTDYHNKTKNNSHGNTNYIPPTMETTAELLLKEKNNIFSRFIRKTNPDRESINKTYNSKIPKLKTDDPLLSRKDLFNTLLV